MAGGGIERLEKSVRLVVAGWLVTGRWYRAFDETRPTGGWWLAGGGGDGIERLVKSARLVVGG